jgi:hypothetical protein
MAIRVSGKNCRISTTCSSDGNGHSTHLYCVSRLKGLKCPLEGTPGVKPFELGPLCFKAVRPEAKKD